MTAYKRFFIIQIMDSYNAVRKWFRERYLQPGDFAPFYGYWVTRSKSLRKLGLECDDYHQTAKLRQGSDILNAYNFTVVFLGSLGLVYIAYK
jgi:hypothetical protein